MTFPKIDLHMHTTISDGTDTPAEIVCRVKEAGITLFSVTDHDATKGCSTIGDTLRKDDPAFICGIEFSCKDEEGKYHILGYGYDPKSPTMRDIVEHGHQLRMIKLNERLDFLEKKFGFGFSEEDRKRLFALSNPGKPHIGNLMVEYGYVATRNKAINEFINQFHGTNEYVRPEDAISAIEKAGGIPVLAHPSFGSGDELILGEEMDKRLRKLMAYGLRGVEVFYSGFSEKLREEMLGFAERYNLFVTAGSDYHGSNKLVRLGDTGLKKEEYPEGLLAFLRECPRENAGR